MSMLPIGIGRCGASLSNILSQYSIDYINYINNLSNSDPNISKLEINTFSDSIKNLYFKQDDLLDSSSLTSRGISIGTQLRTFNSFNDNKSCENLFNNPKNSVKIDDAKIPGNQLTCRTDPTSIIDLSEPSYGIYCYNQYKYREEKEQIESKLMKELENTESTNGILTLAGFGGGAGSGLTSLVSNIISDNMDKTKHIIAGVLPFSYGESTTQSINTILALSSIYDKCDGLILMPNDEYETSFKLSLEKWTHDLNTLIKVYGMSLFHAFRPVASTCSISNRPRYTKSFDYIIDGLCSFPSLKLLDIKLLTQNSKVVSGDNKIHEQMIYQLIDIINNGNRSANSATEKLSLSTKEFKDRNKINIANSDIISFQDFERFKNKVRTTNSEFCNSLKSIPIISQTIKGTTIKDVGILTTGKRFTEELTSNKSNIGIRLIKTMTTKRKTISRNNVVIACQVNLGGTVETNINIADIYKNVMFWNNSSRPIQVTYSKYDKGIYGKLVSNIMNSQSQLEKIDNILVSAEMMYTKNAYIHKYEENGIEKEDIEEAIVKVKNVIENYENIS